jgi:hypothetical protein
MNIGPITWAACDAWSRLTGNRPTADEWAQIRAIDVVFIEVMSADD